ncbi:MAG: hypothetical protein LBP79_01325 [Clostridiales bacterium]|jgi:polyhydroxyalkanoate synthesis regulator phasin|nr:hypothetical protein [Clostridiales bacterium]
MTKQEAIDKMLKRTPADLKRRRIEALKAQLSATDYKAIKYAEGLYSDDEYAATKAEREALREQIRALEEGE